MASISRFLVKIGAWVTLVKVVRMYLDPSSGSFILQVLIAGLLGGLLTIKLFWTRIRTFISRTKTPSDQTADSSEKLQ